MPRHSRRLAIVLGVVVSALPLAAQSRALVFRNITVIDGSGGPSRPAMTVVVRDDRIVAVGNTNGVMIPRGAEVLNGTGRFLIPGLWDMHVHLTDARESAIPGLVANGVTAVRDMGSRLQQLDEWRVRIESGALVGPRIVRAGPILNGKAFGPTHLPVADTIEARAAVRTLAHVGVDFIKIHATLARDQFLAIMDEARTSGLRVAGHLPIGVGPDEASDAGLASVEHTETLFAGTPYPKLPRDEMFSELTRVFQRFARNGTFYTPTLIMYKASADWRDFTPHAQTKYVARSAYEAMVKASTPYRNSPEMVAGRKQVLGTFIELVGMMRRNGVRVMTGTDLADGRIFPGYSVHEELALLVEAGFPAAEAIAAATRVPAEFLKLDDAGTIQQGKRADLVVLKADPLKDIRNTTTIDAVVLGGRLLDRRRLDALLAEAEQLALRN